MRKTKSPRRSRLIRKWDGTLVNETDATGQPDPIDAAELSPRELHSITADRGLNFDSERGDELTDTLER